MFPTKLDGGASHRACEEIVDNAMTAYFEKSAGYPREPWRITDLEFRVMLSIDQLVSRQEIILKNRTHEILITGFGLKKEK